MVENLNTGHYNDGTPIPGNLSNIEWEVTTTGAYAIFGSQEVYGKLYNGYAVLTGKLCPPGWHIATYDEWLALQNYLGRKDVAGSKLKSIEFWLFLSVYFQLSLILWIWFDFKGFRRVEKRLNLVEFTLDVFLSPNNFGIKKYKKARSCNR